MAVAVLSQFRATISRFFFGDESHQSLVFWLTIGLPIIVFFNFSNSWFSGRRLNRVVFRLQFTQAMVFAAGCLLMFECVAAKVEFVIAAYLVSCLAGLLLALCYFRGDMRSDESFAPQDHQKLWRDLLPFALWVWLSNLFVNLFSVCDRLLLVNFLHASSSETTFLIGQYHTSCVFPTLIMTVGGMAASTAMPYFSQDWEAGNRQNVIDRINLVMKCVGIVALASSCALLLVSPFLFGVLWKDKFVLGESLLPMTLCFCSLAGVGMVAQKFFWCIEKTRFTSASLLIGLTVNFLVGLLLIGSMGLQGVVASTFIAHVVVVVVVLIIGGRYGFRVDRGTVVILCATVLIAFGRTAAFVSFLSVTLLVVGTNVIFDSATKRLATERLGARLTRRDSSSSY